LPPGTLVGIVVAWGPGRELAIVMATSVVVLY
jgi:hypothetical protein